jgi:hypothetical protein
VTDDIAGLESFLAWHGFYSFVVVVLDSRATLDDLPTVQGCRAG